MTNNGFKKQTTLFCLLALATVVNAQSIPAPPKSVGTVSGFTQPAPLDFEDHEGYVSLFNGGNLKKLGRQS